MGSGQSVDSNHQNDPAGPMYQSKAFWNRQLEETTTSIDVNDGGST